jgi:hypothetical protein
MLFMESDAAIDKSIRIPFEFRNVPPDKVNKVGEHIIIHPATVSTWFRLKPLFAMIDSKDLEIAKAANGKDFNSEIADVMEKYDKLILEIICIGIHNNDGDMPEWFKKVLRDSCTWEDIYILFNAIVFRLGTSSFLNTIIAMEAVSPLDEREIIALQKNKETWYKAASRS